MSTVTHAVRYLLVGALVVSAWGCAAGDRRPVLVAESGLAVAAAIGQIQGATQAATASGDIPPVVALRLQERLLAINTHLKPLPDLLRMIDRLSAARSDTNSAIVQALTILQAVGSGLTTVLAGVPELESTALVFTLTERAQQAVLSTVITVAQAQEN